MKTKYLLKNGLNIVLILSMILVIFVNVSASESEMLIEGDWEYKIIDDSIAIIGYTGDALDLSIPSTIDGKPVTTIGAYVFNNRPELISVTISKNIETIEKEYNVAKPYFEGCNNLKNIIVDTENRRFSSEGGVLYNKDKTMLMSYPRAKEDKIFDIPDTVKYIERMAFGECFNVNKIIIPNGVTAISERAFEGCYNLESVNIPDGVTTIVEGAFSGCENLKDVVIPNSVKRIGIYAFSGCSSLKKVVIPESVECINDVTPGNRVEGIGAKIMEESLCFSGCSGLEKIIVNSKNSKFSSEDGILYDKGKLQILCYPSGKEEERFTIKSGVEKIRAYTFNQCTNLKSIVIPKSVKKIEDFAITWCDNIENIKFEGEKPNNLDSFILAKNNVNILYPRKLEHSWKYYNIYPKQGYGEPFINVQAITISKKELFIAKGKTYKLYQNISPNNADNKIAIWSSSNPKVATVSQTGVVKAKGKGTCLIIVITNDGKKKATCKVTVTVPVKKLKLNKSKVFIKKGKTYKLRCMITPKNATNKKIVWSSTNKKIVKVTTGKVKALRKGSCYIVVKTKDGKRKAKCKIVVK